MRDSLNPAESDRHEALICILLVAGTLLAYSPLLSAEFISFDDPSYVSENTQVQKGLSFANIGWAFTHVVGGNWHPLTMLSHMLDCQLFGVRPEAHHLVNLFLHAANALLLFIGLRRLTGATWRSGLVAALFAWHPMHVESVAWISERKDVLVTFFALLVILFYTRYVEAARGPGPKWKFFWLALFFFVLALLSKPMVVTLPFVLLLLDYWPWQRISFKRDQLQSWKRVLLEKLPFLILSAGLSVTTFIVQKKVGAVLPMGALPVGYRIINAANSYCRYLEKLVWPYPLYPFYPLPRVFTLISLIVSLGVLALITTGVVFSRRRYLMVGWLWFLGTLVPVIGLVQVGMQSMADRYAYIPSIGIFIMVVWGVAEWTARWPVSAPKVIKPAVGVILAAGLCMTWMQVGLWENSLKLFYYTLKHDPDNATAHYLVALKFEEQGKKDEAVVLLEKAVKLAPIWHHPRYKLGKIYQQQGKTQMAISNYEAIIRVRPDAYEAYFQLGLLLAGRGRLAEAVTNYNRALQIAPDDADAHYNLGNALVAQGRLGDALAHYRESLRLEPNSADAHNNFATLLVKQQRYDEAIAELEEAIKISPVFVNAHINVATLLERQGRRAEAVAHLKRVLEIQPENAAAARQLEKLTNPPAP